MVCHGRKHIGCIGMCLLPAYSTWHLSWTHHSYCKTATDVNWKDDTPMSEWGRHTLDRSVPLYKAHYFFLYFFMLQPSYVQNMTTQLRYLTETLCSCTLSKDTFTQANVTCPSNNEPWSAVVSVWVQYASDDGLVIASDLISMIHN